jgi:hypothetical protein
MIFLVSAKIKPRKNPPIQKKASTAKKQSTRTMENDLFLITSKLPKSLNIRQINSWPITTIINERALYPLKIDKFGSGVPSRKRSVQLWVNEKCLKKERSSL